ncbi:hypothetical protein LQZ24_04745 [Fructobacillus sp. M1-13]|uniref:Uncharacterized protein n=1 Tax=Fructobacillus papyriferae TaxID=2713171 RepID=A0ABS5QRX8_9LACO|nr:hypothetical protein [Fructobacillus papyriferae]MBS9335582.1 hypothetical protein [Fructobacillus papyriferae]MCD2159328.1 hypothetical protein [Fructobacillus papyriferae]
MFLFVKNSYDFVKSLIKSLIEKLIGKLVSYFAAKLTEKDIKRQAIAYARKGSAQQLQEWIDNSKKISKKIEFILKVNAGLQKMIGIFERYCHNDNMKNLLNKFYILCICMAGYYDLLYKIAMQQVKTRELAKEIYQECYGRIGLVRN